MKNLPNTLNLGIALLSAYLLGSIPTAVWVGRLQKNIDIREHGSGNAGLTNAIRVLGWKGAGPVLVVDLLKGILAPLMVVMLCNEPNNGLWAMLAGLLAVMGHSFTCFAGFRGGKGVLTGLGVFLALAPVHALLAFSVWILTVKISKYVSLGSILACVALILLLWSDFFLDWASSLHISTATLPVSILGSIVGTFVIYKHKTNIQRLLDGKENKIGTKK